MEEGVSTRQLQALCNERPECIRLARELAKKIANVLKHEDCDCLLFSGGIDTGFVLAAGLEFGWKPRLVSVLFPGGKDNEFVQRVSVDELLEHVVLRVSLDSPLIEDCLTRVMKVLRTIDPVEVFAGITTCLGLDLAKRLGCRCVATGDAGDELFFGYDFLLDKDQEYLSDWLSWVSEKAFYSSKPIGESLGLKVIHPLNTVVSKEIAFLSPIGCKIARLSNGTRVGKLLMRCYLLQKGMTTVATRAKTPITGGSGVEEIVDKWASKVSVDDAIEFCRREGILLPSLPHVYLYKKFRKVGLARPAQCENSENACPLCGACLSDRGYCRFCGAVVRGDKVSFHGGEWGILGKLREYCSTR